MPEIYVGDTDMHARAEAQPYLFQYWQLWNRYTQFTRDGRLPDSMISVWRLILPQGLPGKIRVLKKIGNTMSY